MKKKYFGKEDFEKLEEVANDASHDYVGLHAILRAQMKFNKSDSREEIFYEKRRFALSENERVFHLMGFMDAISWLYRNKMLDIADHAPFYSEENMTRLRKAIDDVKSGKTKLTEHELIDVEDELPEEMLWLEEESKNIDKALWQFIKWSEGFC